MWLALLRKELMETAGIGLVAMGALLAWVGLEVRVGILTGLPFWSWFGISMQEISSIPFLDMKMHTPLAFVGGVLASVLTVRQVFYEDQKRVYGLLFHLPVPRSTLFLTKMIAGMVVYFLAMTIPVLVYAWWAATPGHHPSPFYWSMIWLPIKLIAVLTLLYFGWFLTWLRPARWTGTRLLPIVTTGALGFMFADLVEWWPAGVVLVVLANVLLAVSILWVAEKRDY